MITFLQYLEGMKVFNTRDAAYEIPVAADLATDLGDSGNFLAPIARKIKAFGHYAFVAAEELQDDRSHSHAHTPGLEPSPSNKSDQMGLTVQPPSDEETRDYRKGFTASGARQASIRTMISARKTEVHPLHYNAIRKLAAELRRFGSECHEFVWNYQDYAEKKEADSLRRMKKSLTDMLQMADYIATFEVEDWYQEFTENDMIEKIKDRFKRIQSFLQQAESNIGHMDHNPPPSKPLASGFRGRWIRR